MDTEKALRDVSRQLEQVGIPSPVWTGAPTAFEAVEADAIIGTVPVRIVMQDWASEPAQYRFVLSVHERETGQKIITGNGSPTLQEALESLNWGPLRTAAR